MAEKLWELESVVGDAIDCVNRALTMTSTFLTDLHTGEPLPWGEMELTAERLSEAMKHLQEALKPLGPALESEREYLDHMSDLADGASY